MLYSRFEAKQNLAVPDALSEINFMVPFGSAIKAPIKFESLICLISAFEWMPKGRLSAH